MKKFDKILAGIAVLYLLLSAALAFYLGENSGSDGQYKVEINEIYYEAKQQPVFVKPKLENYKFVKAVTFLPIDGESKDSIDDFYKSHNGLEYEIRPVYDKDKLTGYLRFDYSGSNFNEKLFVKAEIILFIFAAIIASILIYIRNVILKPFNIISDMPYELSKGNLKKGIKENKNRYFGRFIWGINVLRENLEQHKIKELKLEKEKKLLVLSISHDIKTPLNAIKLYAKAIVEGLYATDEKKIFAAKQIQEKSLEIENFVKEIIKTSSEDVLEIQVVQGEFYLSTLIDKVIATYQEESSLKMIDFVVENYSNKLIKGDIDRSFEVIGNILENAFKYGNGKEIRISFYEEDYCQLIKIYNSGKTVNQNEFNHIFDSFYRASNAKDKQGNGLGLYICKYIMEKMDGEVFAQCEKEGMSFTLVFR
ncbi:HAMP domain-containing histidine kinase [Clostridium sp. 19966]|uniref:sensor histidine kinase n=1 Tax=Clostridium sp. 19966 TaxID=2768166 RepID=UPI0028E097DC|nr:HAMP domain-containing sensor histidine kinase [Clostridium sp. 19966]MDT8715346.1 HAMP domain-containing histidine kinase [Clostridium sp. 19966]